MFPKARMYITLGGLLGMPIVGGVMVHELNRPRLVAVSPFTPHGTTQGPSHLWVVGMDYPKSKSKASEAKVVTGLEALYTAATMKAVTVDSLAEAKTLVMAKGSVLVAGEMATPTMETKIVTKSDPVKGTKATEDIMIPPSSIDDMDLPVLWATGVPAAMMSWRFRNAPRA